MSYAGHHAPDCEDHHDLVRDFGGPKPTIVVLCGSTRFVDEFNRQRKILTEHGQIVLSIEVVTTQAPTEDPQHVDPNLKERLDELHKRKIDLADEVLVLNVGGYIGDSTRSEIDYAEKAGKPIRYLEPLPRDLAKALRDSFADAKRARLDALAADDPLDNDVPDETHGCGDPHCFAPGPHEHRRTLGPYTWMDAEDLDHAGIPAPTTTEGWAVLAAEKPCGCHCQRKAAS